MRNRVIICEASEIITNGLAEIINSMAQFDVVLRIDSPERLSEKIVATDANMLVINPSLLGYEGKDFLLKLSKEYPHVSLVALVTSCLEHSSLAPYGGIIDIYDSKQKIVGKLNEWVNDNNPKKNDDVELSKRETDVLVAVAKGMMNKEIADQMNISIHTVISHRKNITRKTGIKSVSGLTVYALLNNLIKEDELI
ncbi:MAG: response regulator transcription factor [Bacteroidales bacterium]|nr:response regulator transcription factor [Bacteroidales bacterium]